MSQKSIKRSFHDLPASEQGKILKVIEMEGWESLSLEEAKEQAANHAFDLLNLEAAKKDEMDGYQNAIKHVRGRLLALQMLAELVASGEPLPGLGDDEEEGSVVAFGRANRLAMG